MTHGTEIILYSINIVLGVRCLGSFSSILTQFMGTELYGKTAVIIGLGHIGREVALRLQAFGMKTIGFDAIVPAEDTKSKSVVSFPEVRMVPLAKL